MPNTCIEPATLRSLARRFNQLSYAATSIQTHQQFCLNKCNNPKAYLL